MNRCRASGFSLAELVVVIAIIASLTAVLLQRIPLWQARAEAAAMDTVLGSLRSALMIHFAALAARQQHNMIASLVSGNPMDLLSDKPENYLGELVGKEQGRPGAWFFNRDTRALVYVVQNRQQFSGGDDAGTSVQFFVHPVYSTSAAASRGSLAGLNLRPRRPYQWNFTQT